MKKTQYKVKKDSGRFFILERKPGHQYFTKLEGRAFFDEKSARAFIQTLVQP